LCPFENSLDIERKVPNARLVRVAGAGHNAFDARMVKALMHEIREWVQ
jgi:pimeloyl-ACP methyl ester carboxylesterase